MIEQGASAVPSSFSPEEYVTLLYKALLDREPDSAGLVAHATALRRHGDPSAIIRTFVASEEYRNKSGQSLLDRLEGGKSTMLLAPRSDALSFVLKASERHFSDPVFVKDLAKRGDLFPTSTREIKVIALYYWRMNNGGTERVTARQALMWTRMGYKVILITDQQPMPDEDYDYGPDVRRYVLPERMMQGSGYSRRGRTLADILQLEQVDLFVTNQWYEVSTVWDMLVAKSLGIPTILGWHNVFDAGIHEIGDLGRAYLRYHGYRQADLVAVLSEVDRLWFASWGTPARLVHNPQTFDAMPARLPALEGATILWLARVEKHQKRIDHALRMFPLVLAKIPDASLLVVGGGPDLDWAREYAHALGVGHRVHFAGYTTEVGRYIDRAAVHVMTSEFEGYPMVLGEVWSHGVPTVMYNLPNLEYIRSGRGYVAVEQKNVEQLAAAVIDVLRDAPRRSRMGAEARTVVEEFAASDLEGEWKDIFGKIGRGEDASAHASDDDAGNDAGSLRILVRMLGDKMLSLYGPNNADDPQPYLPSHAPTEAPKTKGGRRLARAARAVIAPYAAARRLITRRTPASALRMIDLSDVGLGDNLMIWTGLHALLENGVPLCAPGCVIHVQPILADLCSRLFARFGLVVQRGVPQKQISPAYSPLPPTTFSQWWRTYLGRDWRMNWVEAVDLQKSFPRHWADRSFQARVRLRLSERFIYRRRSWEEATPSYIGFRVWQPVAARHGIHPTVFLSQMKRSLPAIRRVFGNYIDEITPPERRGRYAGNAAFPVGKSFQTIPPSVCEEVDRAIERTLSCYVQEDSPWHGDFQKAGVETHHLADVSDTFRIVRYADRLLTTDSFTSHVAQLLRDDFVLVLSRDLKESIVHPGANPQIVANHPPCAPCNYQERAHFDRCVAGYRHCIAFEDERFTRDIATALRS